MKLDEAISILETIQGYKGAPTTLFDPAKLHEAITVVLAKVKPKDTSIDWDNLIKFFNKTFDKSSRIIPQKAKTSYIARLREGFTKDDIRRAMTNAKDDKHHIESNYRHCTLEFFSRGDKLDKFSSIKPKADQAKKPYIPTA